MKRSVVEDNLHRLLDSGVAVTMEACPPDEITVTAVQDEQRSATRVHRSDLGRALESLLVFEYRGALYPEYIKTGNACRFIAPMAAPFCRGKGLDVGAGRWPLPGAIPVDLQNGGDAMALPEGVYDYVFSSHLLEHLTNPVAALEHWKTRIKPGCPLFLYLPHPDMTYWRPTANRKHLHEWQPEQMERMLIELGFVKTLRSERDLAWSFAVVGFVPNEVTKPSGAVFW